MAEKTKNRRKLLKRICSNCNSRQDLFASACKECGTSFLQDSEREIRDRVEALVDEVEEAIRLLQTGGDSSSPYKPMDRAANALKSLKGFEILPGMAEYREESKAILRPFKVALQRSTLRANMIMWVILIVMPMAGLAFGMDFSVLWMMFLPAIFWGFVTGKAWMDLKNTREGK